MFYVLSGIQLKTQCNLPTFADFEGQETDLPTIELSVANEPFSASTILHTFYHKDINITVLEKGWLYTLAADKNYQLYVSEDYKKLTAHITAQQSHYVKLQPLLRTAIECASASYGLISLHSACVETERKAICFTAFSGVGKSTRAQSWVKANSAEFISGDRPQIKITYSGVFACGVPWDGKEKIYRNISLPLTAICRVIRSKKTKIRKLTVSQARRILSTQCFIPMWDTDTAVKIMALITVLCQRVPIYNMFCGPDEDSAREVKKILYEHQNDILEEEKDMKIKNGYVLRTIADQYVVMPTGENISDFAGTIILNSVSAFVWKKLEKGLSRDELLIEILDEFEIESDIAEKDLDDLILKLQGYGVIEEI